MKRTVKKENRKTRSQRPAAYFANRERKHANKMYKQSKMEAQFDY